MNIGKAYSFLMSYLRKTAKDYRYQPTISSMLFLWSLNQYANETNTGIYVWSNMNIRKAYSSLMSYLIRKTAEDYRYQPTISSMLFLWSLTH